MGAVIRRVFDCQCICSLLSRRRDQDDHGDHKIEVPPTPPRQRLTADVGVQTARIITNEVNGQIAEIASMNMNAISSELTSLRTADTGQSAPSIPLSPNDLSRYHDRSKTTSPIRLSARIQKQNKN